MVRQQQNDSIHKKNSWRSLIVFSLLLSFLSTSLFSCFGRFALVRTVYKFNDSIKVDPPLLQRFVKTLLMYALDIPLIPVYFIAGFLDVLIFNLIEFWTGENILMDAKIPEIKGSKDTSFRMKDGSTVSLYRTKVRNQNALVIQVQKPKEKNQDFYAFQDKPGQLFSFEKGEFVPIRTARIDLDGLTWLEVKKGSEAHSKVISY